MGQFYKTPGRQEPKMSPAKSRSQPATPGHDRRQGMEPGEGRLELLLSFRR
jgi:hypothetical protein